MDPTLTQPVTLDAPDSAEGVKPQPVTMPTVPGEVTTTSLVPPGPNVPSVFPVLAVTPNPDAAPPVPPGITLGEPDLEVQVADRSMGNLAQSVAVNEAGGNPHARSFSGVMTGLRQALQPLFDTDNVSEADMEARWAHTWHTRQVVSDRILGHSRKATQSQL